MWLSYTDPTTWGEAVPTCVVSGGGEYCGGVRHGRGIHSDYLLPRTVQLHAREFHWQRSALWEELYCVYTQLLVLWHQWNYTEIRSIACQSKTGIIFVTYQIKQFFMVSNPQHCLISLIILEIVCPYDRFILYIVYGKFKWIFKS